MTFGAILKNCRERAGLTQEQLAEMLHRSRSCISKIEADKKTLDAATLIRWGDATSAKEVVCAIVYGIDPNLIMQHMQTFLSLFGSGFITFFY
ncbi:helix-turn-helix domain-containing protein [Cytobacillus praedii]|uniref:helix-turn-helix domain-containing protein n=1 Tax=Cytobacillus praedii TaxID=1742358 RepID=UPI003F80E4FD